MGTTMVMREQVQHLAELALQPKITIQVIPFLAGSHAALGGGFTLLQFPEPDLPHIVYIEHLTGALYVDTAPDVGVYRSTMARLLLEAESPDRTVAFLEAIVEDYD